MSNLKAYREYKKPTIKKTGILSARVPLEYKKYIKQHQLSVKLIICKTIDKLRKKWHTPKINHTKVWGFSAELPT